MCSIESVNHLGSKLNKLPYIEKDKSVHKKSSKLIRGKYNKGCFCSYNFVDFIVEATH